MAERHATWKALPLLTVALTMMAFGSSIGGTRDPILADSWYPGDGTRLREEVTSYLQGGSASEERMTALIVPHAGYRYSGPTAGKGFAAVKGQSFDRVIMMGPSHRLAF